MAAIVAHHALRNARGTRRVENIERIGCCHGHALARLGVVDRIFPHLAPVVVAALRELRLALRTLEDHAGLRLVLREIDRLVEQRLVGHDACALDTAAGGEDDLRLAIIEAGGELFRCKPAEHHRVDGADARASEHCEHRLRHHRHVDDDAVALLHAEVAEDSAEQLHLGQHAAVGEGLHGVGDRRVVNQRRLVIAAGEHMTIERVVAGVAGGPAEPAAIDAGVLVEDLLRLFKPVNIRRGFCPEHLRAPLPMRIHLVITARPGVHFYPLGLPHPEEARSAVSKDERSPPSPSRRGPADRSSG